jgi:hypothetical protein
MHAFSFRVCNRHATAKTALGNLQPFDFQYFLVTNDGTAGFAAESRKPKCPFINQPGKFAFKLGSRKA